MATKPSSSAARTPDGCRQVPCGFDTLLQKQGKPGQLTLGEEKRNGETGMILAKNGMEISCTFASLLDSRRLDMEADIAAILFPDRPA